MADRLPYGGNGAPSTANRPKRVLYQQKSWTLPVGGNNMTALEYDLAVGRITQAEFDAGLTRSELDFRARDARERECAALSPAQERAVINTPRTK